MNIEQSAKDLLKYLAVELDVFDEDLELSYDTDLLNIIIDNVLAKAGDDNIANLIIDSIEGLTLDTAIDMTDDVNSYVLLKNVRVVVLSQINDTKFRIRNFAIASEVGAIIPIKFLLDSEPYEVSESEKDLIERKFRETLLYHGTISQEGFSEFYQKINSQHKHKVIAVHDTTDHDFTKLYSKSYFLYLLNGNKTLFSEDIVHDYRVDSDLKSAVSSSAEDFTQFFEIYDVIDEYHHANDILVKYLKLYQIIEYLITRAILVKIQVNNTNQNLFLREMASLAKYDDFDKSNFKKVFESDQLDLGGWFKTKIENSSSLKLAIENLLYPNETKRIEATNLNASYNALLALIYKLRNTIVHNKESEIHLTIHNIKLRPELLTFIKELMLKLEHVIFGKIVKFEPVIVYQQKQLNLY